MQNGVCAFVDGAPRVPRQYPTLDVSMSLDYQYHWAPYRKIVLAQRDVKFNAMRIVRIHRIAIYDAIRL